MPPKSQGSREAGGARKSEWRSGLPVFAEGGKLSLDAGSCAGDFGFL